MDEHDSSINVMGAKGISKIAIVGTSAVVANALFHTTGRYLRSWPIIIANKVLEALHQPA